MKALTETDTVTQWLVIPVRRSGPVRLFNGRTWTCRTALVLMWCSCGRWLNPSNYRYIMIYLYVTKIDICKTQNVGSYISRCLPPNILRTHKLDYIKSTRIPHGTRPRPGEFVGGFHPPGVPPWPLHGRRRGRWNVPRRQRRRYAVDLVLT